MLPLDNRCFTCSRRVPDGADCDKPETFEGRGWTYRCDNGWTCPHCAGARPSVVHSEWGGEHVFVLAGVVEARTTNWGIAKVFAATLVELAVKGGL